MLKNLIGKTLTITVLLALPYRAFAIGVYIDPSQTFEITTNAGKVLCGSIDGYSYIPGQLKKGTLFVPLSDKQKKIKKKMKNKTGAALTKLQTQLKNIKKKNKQGKPVCALGPDGSTPPPSGGNFDQQGNVTAAGKVRFGIPSHLSANINTGLVYYNNYCNGCHDPVLGKKFYTYRAETSQDPMYYDETTLPDEVLANITAYLNRFKLL